MVSKRDRILELKEYLTTLNIVVNIGKTKARGNKGFFKVGSNSYRIDIAKELPEEEAFRVLVHEFAHFFHYQNDKTLKNLDFIIENFTDIELEELLNITVESISKKDVEPLFTQKKILENSITNSRNFLTINYKKKMLRSINSKIARLNRYYNSPTELFARSLEMYVIKPQDFQTIAPNLYKNYNAIFNENKFPILTKFLNIAKNHEI